MERRTYLRSAAGIVTAGVFAGCSGDGGGNGNGNGESDPTVAATASNVFDPETITISTGETVTWTFESAGHNVECNPEQSDQAALPEGADPFASYEGDNRFDTNAQGSTYEYQFDVAGEYTYVCVPHAAQGMVGTVVVEE